MAEIGVCISAVIGYVNRDMVLALCEYMREGRPSRKKKRETVHSDHN